MKYSSRHYAEALYNALQNKQGEEYKRTIKNFVTILKKNKDYRSLPLILSRYEKIFLNKQGLKKVEIESVNPISSELRKKIEKTIGGKILLDEKINPDLLGGITILINDTLLIDASLKTRINTLCQKL